MAPEHRYAQFCPMARAAEILGERWTLLILRELLCGPQRFTDLRRRLPGISSSVLSERLGRLEERGVLLRRDAPPPAPATLYTLSELGASLRTVVLELMRFGIRFIDAPRPDDHLEADWTGLALEAFALRAASPERRFAVEVKDEHSPIHICVAGGPEGTRVSPGPGEGPFDARLRLGPMPLLGLAAGSLPAALLVDTGQLEVDGDLASLSDFPALFDLGPLLARPQPEAESA